MTPQSLIVGIDNGTTGGVVIMEPDCSILGYAANPVHTPVDKNEVDVLALRSFIKRYAAARDVVFAIEEPLKHAPSSQSMRSMSISFGLCVGMALASGWSVRRVQVAQWQRAMLGKKLPKGVTKKRALEEAKKFWPAEEWLASSRCRTPHDGIVDAALIARYTITHHYHEPN